MSHCSQLQAQGLDLQTQCLPDPSCQHSNCVYLCPADLHVLCGDGHGPHYIEVKGCVFSALPHGKVASGAIGYGSLHRELAKLSSGHPELVRRYRPPKGSELGFVRLEISKLRKERQSKATALEVPSDDIDKTFRTLFTGQVFQQGQAIAIEFENVVLKCVVAALQPVELGFGDKKPKSFSGVFIGQTQLEFQQGDDGSVHIMGNNMQQRSIFRPDFDFETLGIGGLDKEFADIFRRAFGPRVFPSKLLRDLGTTHIKGMLLHGPPGSGKTLVARQLAKFLKCAEPKIVNGPEIMSKYVGQSEQNVRDLFAAAEKDQMKYGENSLLHVIILDEMDAICKTRGSSGNSSGVGDNVVNQLLTMVDGVNGLNNVLLIGMTNRKDLIDPAMLRSGRLEVIVEVPLANEKGRVEILNIHMAKMKSSGHLDPAVSVEALASQTRNFSGAELSGLCRDAVSFAMNRHADVRDIKKTIDPATVMINNSDFANALKEIKPLYGQREDDFQHCIGRTGIITYSREFQQLESTIMSHVEQVRCSDRSPLLTVLLHGCQGCGKTALTARCAMKSDFPFMRRITCENMVGWSEHEKIAEIRQTFEDSYKSPLSVIIIDDLERILEYVPIGPRFSNQILQTLFSLMKRPPPTGSRLLVLGTTSEPGFLRDAELHRAFAAAHAAPSLSQAGEFAFALRGLPGFEGPTVEEIASALAGRRLGIRTLLIVAEMAVQWQNPVEKDAFMQCLGHALH